MSVSAIASRGSLENGEESSQGNGSVMRLAPSWLAAVKDRAKLAALFDRFLAALDNAPAAS